MASTICGRPSATLLILVASMPFSARYRWVPDVAIILKPAVESVPEPVTPEA